MATTDNKNQVTLYRFVSLRSPELSKKEDQEKRFVFHPDNQTGVFFNAVANKLPDETKFEAMKKVSFSPFKDEKELENLNTEFYKVSEWLSRNKSSLNVEELYSKVKMLKPFEYTKPSDTEFLIWDNLFYQVVHQSSFYVKEAVMQVLVLQNLVKQLRTIDEKEISLFLPLLANAKVILPEYLFSSELDNAITSKVNFRKVEEEMVLDKELFDAQLIQSSKNSIENLENLIEDLKGLEKDYSAEYQKSYNEEIKVYQNEVSTILETYRKEYNEENRKLCEIPRDEHYDTSDICYQPDVKSPEIPEFAFNYDVEFDIKKIEAQLTEESFSLLTQIITRKKITTFQEAIDLVSKEMNKDSITISQRTIATEKTITIGDTVIFSKQSSSKGTEIPFQICSTRLTNGMVSMYMSIQLPNNTYDISHLYYTLQYNTGNNTHGGYVKTMNGNVMTLSKLYNDNLPFSVNNITRGITGYIKFTNGQEFTFLINPFSLVGCYQGKLILKGSEDTGSGGENPTENNSFVPKGFGYRQLGIADYKKVVAEVCCYEPGEVAHIENVMASELRSKVSTKTYKSEVTDFDSTEIEKEEMTDVVSTQRFEMQTEVSKLLAQQKQLSAYADVHTSWGNTTLDAGVAYASNTAKEESNRQAVNQAKELTQRAVERIVSKVRNEKTVKITNEYIEENTHAFDNRGNTEHISGVFRFINAVYKNQIYNYGKRLMYEFVVPEPSKLHRLAMQVVNNNENAVVLDKPIDPAALGITDFTKITSTNYQNLAAKYNADVEVYPQMQMYLNKTVSEIELGNHEIIEGSSEIQIPEGYQPVSAKLKFAAKWDRDGGQSHSANIAFGNYALFGQGLHSDIKEINLTGYQLEYPLESFMDKVSFSYGLANYHSCNISLSIKIQIKDDKLQSWKKSVYNAIIKGYQEQLALYNEKLSEAKTNGSQMLDSNPLFYRQIEQMVLRKNCISYLLDNSAGSARRFGRKMYTGDSIINHQVTANQEMDDYGSFAKFMEQAFEWNIMSYNFYPYYWGNDGEWSKLYQYETNDPIFRSFMQAGMARVVVTVKPGFEDAVMHYMTTGQIWNGGQTPILGDPLYLSIVDELKEQEYVVDETWKTVVPTHLIALQKSGVALDAEGLPCNCPAVDELNKDFVPNRSVLSIGTPQEKDEELLNRVAKIESRMIENIDINNGKISLTTKGKNRQTVAQISVEDLKREMGK